MFLEKFVYWDSNCLFKDLSVLEGVCELKQAERRSRSEEQPGTEEMNHLGQSGDGFAELTGPKETPKNFRR